MKNRMVKVFSITLTFIFTLGISISLGQAKAGSPAEDFSNVTTDGAWVWLIDPRCIYYKGNAHKTYCGYMKRQGTVEMWELDHATGNTQTFALHQNYHRDDHDNPGLYIQKNGKLIAYYQKHGGEQFMRYRVTSNPEDISAWDPVQQIPVGAGVTYSHIFRLSQEQDNVYLFLRGLQWHPNILKSVDDGLTYDTPKVLVGGGGARPYIKFGSDGKTKIHLAYTDGHPRNEATNSIYYNYYENNKFYNADGTEADDMTSLPIDPQTEGDMVYDGSTNGRAWIWDVHNDTAGNPILVYSVMPQETDHRYYYSRWDGSKWVTNELTRSGRWFPQTPQGNTEPEPHYSGGIVLDHSNTNVVYLSKQVNGLHEIERWETKDGGSTWDSLAITSGSAKMNIRPQVTWGHPSGTDPSPQVVTWMHGDYVHYTNYTTEIKYWIDRPGCPDSKYIEFDSARTIDDMSLCQTVGIGSRISKKALVSDLNYLEATIQFIWNDKSDVEMVYLIDVKGRKFNIDYNKYGSVFEISAPYLSEGVYHLIIESEKYYVTKALIIK